jgi:hypothetical protein
MSATIYQLARCNVPQNLVLIDTAADTVEHLNIDKPLSKHSFFIVVVACWRGWNQLLCIVCGCLLWPEQPCSQGHFSNIHYSPYFRYSDKATGWTIRSSIAGRDKRFISAPVNLHGLWGSPTLVFNVYRGSSQVVKRPGCETQHSHVVPMLNMSTMCVDVIKHTQHTLCDRLLSGS